MLKPKKQQNQQNQQSQPSQKQDEQQHQQQQESKPDVPPKLPPTHPVATGQHSDKQAAVPLAGAGTGAAAPDAGSSSIANAVNEQYHKSADDNTNKPPVSPVGPTPISKDDRTVSMPVSAMSADEDKPLPVPKTETAPVTADKVETAGMQLLCQFSYTQARLANSYPSSPPLANLTPSLPTSHQREHQTQRHRAFHHHYHYRRRIIEDHRSPATRQSLLRLKPRRRRRENARHGRRAAGDQGQSRRSGHERDFGPARRFPAGRRQALGWIVAAGVLATPLGVGGVFCLVLFYFALLVGAFEDFCRCVFERG
jgi:hypothetical protein